MEEYSNWEKKALNSARIYRDPQFQTGMEELIKVINTCGYRFVELPDPPDEVIVADQSLREMGKELKNFAGNLQCLLGLNDAKERKRELGKLAKLSQTIKQDYHCFFTLYERSYPNRLSHVLESFRKD